MIVGNEWSVTIDYNDMLGGTEWIRGPIDPMS